jgi:hypothetical protein
MAYITPNMIRIIARENGFIRIDATDNKPKELQEGEIDITKSISRITVDMAFDDIVRATMDMLVSVECGEIESEIEKITASLPENGFVPKEIRELTFTDGTTWRKKE